MRTQLLASAFLAFILFVSGVVSDTTAQENERRFSISINGGVTVAGDGLRGSPTGGIGIETDPQIVFGGSLQYSFTPSYSLALFGQYHRFENADGARIRGDLVHEFESEIIHIGLRNIIHLNQLLGLNSVSNYIGPFGHFGFGVNIYDNDSNLFGTESGEHLAGVIGLGLNIYLSRTIDLFGQYDYHLTTNAVGARSNSSTPETGANRRHVTYGIAHGGLRFHFGSSDARSMTWRRAPMNIYEDDYNRLMALNSRIDEIERQLEDQDQEIRRLEQDLQTKTRQIEGNVEQHETRITNLERQFAEMQETVRDLDRRRDRMVETDDQGLTQQLADGHYVQVYAGLTMAQARNARNMIVEALDGVIENPSQRVLITQRRQFYEVRVGVFNRFPDTVDVLRTAQNVFSDSFVVTFPRPAHLRDQYQDIRKAE